MNDTSPCPDCDGLGEYDVDVPRRHGPDRDSGYLDSKTVICETCGGAGEVDD